jgi:hypothetical protein
MGRRQYNNHHPLWTRREHQRTAINAKLRDQIVIPMRIYAHATLHEEVMPPMPPSEALARELLAVVTAEDYNPMEKFGMAIMHLYRASNDMGHPYHRQAQMIHNNFIEQAQYMD